jgi:NADH:quinone reductase (non-electrogenic)
MKTRITELFGIKYPIVCGGMFWLCEPELCAAISNAGALGNITALRYETKEELRAAIQRARELTNNPFGINITLLPSIRIPPERYDEFFGVCAEEKVTAIEVSGAPATKYIDMLHKAGVKVMHKVGAVRHAKNIERFGYDAIIAAGLEEGGHPLNDDVATTVLTPRIAEAVKIPVITAGGIADGRGLAAAMALGADAVLMASRFMATHECQTHSAIKSELIKREEHETTLIGKSLGLQGRGLKTGLVAKILEVEARKGGIEELAPLMTATRIPEAAATGDVEGAVWYVGQSIGLIKEVVSCKELIDGMVKEAEEILKKTLAKFQA